MFSGVFTLYCIYLLLEVRAKTNGRSYSEIGQICYGTPGKTLVNITLMFTQLGYPIAFLYFVIENFYDLFQTEFGFVWADRNVIAAFWFVVFASLAYVRKLAIFARTHVFADAMIMLMLAVVIIYGLQLVYVRGALFKEVPFFNPHQYSDSLGFSVFAYEGIGLILPVQDITADKKKYPFVINMVLVSMAIIFISFGLMCTLSYGNDQTPIISDELPMNWFTWIIKVLFCLNVMFSYPL